MWQLGALLGYYAGAKIGNELFRLKHCPNPYYTPPPWWHPTLSAEPYTYPFTTSKLPSMTQSPSSAPRNTPELR